MIFARRCTIPIVAIAFCLLVFYLYRSPSKQWRQVPQAVGLGEVGGGVWNVSYSNKDPYAPQPHYVPGIPKPPGSNYTKMMVAARLKEEDGSWVEDELPDWQTAIYVADDPEASLHPPKNKGHEVMIYLSFIIDNYDNLPDIVAFVHAHQYAWHNDDLFGGDAAEMLRKLSPERVVREGYMNLRCNWGPGCPDWMHPGAIEEDSSKQEETMLARSWGEIFPEIPVPEVLAQTCCAQFAASRERILATPRSRYIFYRDWILRTTLSDYISGRVWEYLWHFVFTGETVVCPKENVCYCDGYGICFGGEDEYFEYRAHTDERGRLEGELRDWQTQAQTIEAARFSGPLSETDDLDIPDPGLDIKIEGQINEKTNFINELMLNATVRGSNPRLRALEAGRQWKEGDGF